MALINCKECGKEISDTADSCPHCGYKEYHKDMFQHETQQPVQQVFQPNEQQVVANNQQNINQANKKNLLKNKTFLLIIGIVLILVIAGISITKVLFDKHPEENLPIKVDISMTSYYGYIDDILDELGLDFDLVTMGANCYTGVQENEFQTEKYGLLHTEFRYCAYNETQVFRVYNSDIDQPLREPKPGELATFNIYGEKITSSNSSL